MKLLRYMPSISTREDAIARSAEKSRNQKRLILHTTWTTLLNLVYV